MRALILGLMLGFCWLAANAASDIWQFDDPQQTQRFERLIEELRCPKCQNQNLADSNSAIAEDLREVVYRLVKEGKSDEEVKSWLVERYGDYVLYRPAWSARTLLLWLGPAVALLVALAGAFVFLRRSTLARQSGGTIQLSDEEQQKIASLMDANDNNEERS